MKIEITFAPTQLELADALVAELKRHFPGAVLKRTDGKPNDNGVIYTHYRLDDGRKW